MPIPELEDLFALVATPEDRSLFEQILERNQPARDYVESGKELYKAFGEGDPAAVARVATKTRTAAPPPPAVTTPSFDMTQFDAQVDKKVKDIFGQLLETPTFNDRVKGLVKTTADELAPGMYATSSRNANEIYDVKRSHEKEFGSDLDMTKFNEFLEANKGKYATLSDVHNAFVSEDRINIRIAKGVKDGVEAEVSKQVPGTTTSRSTTPSMADRFVAINKTKTESDRGEVLNDAARAFRQLRQQSAVE